MPFSTCSSFGPIPEIAFRSSALAAFAAVFGVAPLRATFSVFSAAGTSALLPLLTLGNPKNATLPLGVQYFATAYSQDTAAVLAFTSLAMLPALLFFTIAQRRIVSGLTGAVKG